MTNRAPDVVYPLKRKSQYEELRYSLRSLKNVPHGRVFIAGHELPKWAKHVIHIPVTRIKGENGFMNAERNWIAACSHPKLSDDFIAMNDDFFIMKPMDRINAYHDGDLKTYINYRVHLGINENYEVAMRSALKFLQEMGIEKPVGYTLHVPMMMNKYKRINLHHMFRYEILRNSIVLMRTLYGNLYSAGGEEMIDVKMIDGREWEKYEDPFLSTNDPSFKYEKIGELIRSKFPEKSPYEI